MHNKKSKFFLPILAVSMGLIFLNGHFIHSGIESAEAYTAQSAPKTNINLNDCTEDEIKNYYSSTFSGKSSSQLSGTNLLATLKTRLIKDQLYYAYNSAIWDLYEIADRDWQKSPASAIPNYNPSTNIISSYTYGENGINPYLHSLYNNRNVSNQTRAWGSHGDRRNAWTIEREHVWAKSHGLDGDDDEGGARGDPMHLISANGTANGKHSNYFYGYVNKSKTHDDCGSVHSNIAGNLTGTSSTLSGSSTTVFEPQDSDKGDIARALFYMVARYNDYAGTDSSLSGSNGNLQLIQSASDPVSGTYASNKTTKGSHGIISDLLNWNRIDPPDEFEIHRNNLLFRNFTHNRNPFIDYPEWAEYIWGSATYEGRTYKSYSSSSTGSVDLSTDVLNNFKGASTDNVTLNKTAIELNVGKTETIAATSSDGSQITWSLSDNTVASVSDSTSASGSNITITGLSSGVSTLTATARINNKNISKSATITVKKSGGGGTSGYTLLTNTSSLNVGDSLVIAAKNAEYALSTDAQTYYRGRAEITKSDNMITWGSSLDNPPQVITLGGTSGHWTLNVGGTKYLCASNSTSYNNLLTTEFPSTSDITDYGKWSISIGSDGQALIKANKSGTESAVGSDEIRYNDGNARFSCYKSTSTQAPVSIYKLIEDEQIDVTGVTLDHSSLEMDYGATATLHATVAPTNATEKTVLWSSSNEFVVSVNNDGQLTANKEGTSTITVTTLDGGFTASCEVTVLSDPITGITIDESESKLSYFYNEGFKTNKIVVKATHQHSEDTLIDPESCTYSIGNGTIFTSSDGSSKSLTVTYGDYSTTTTIRLSKHRGAIYTPTSSSAVSSENVPDDSSATFLNTNTGDKTRVTANDTMTLTLSGYDNNKITGVSLLMNSNSKSGAGSITITCGNALIGNIGNGTNPVSFDEDAFNGEFTSIHGFIDVQITNKITCRSGEDIIIRIVGSENSLYVREFAVEYEKATESYYEKVTSDQADWSGEYLIVASVDSFNYTWTGVDAGQCHTDVVVNNNIINTKPSDAVTITIAQMDGGYSLCINGGTNDGKYMGNKDYSNGITFKSDEQVNTISFTNNELCITAAGGCNFRYNKAEGSSNERFRYYKSGQTEVSLYKLVGSSEDPNLTAARNYAITMDEAIVCYGGASTPAISGTTWTALKTTYVSLDSKAKTYLVEATFVVSGSTVTPLDDTDQDIANAMAKYDQLVSRYSFENFINRQVMNSTTPTLKEFLQDSSLTILLIVVGGIAATICGCYFIVRRKHQ